MAKKIQAWTAFGPRILLGDPTRVDRKHCSGTNQSKGSVLAVLSEMDVQLEAGLKSGRIVKQIVYNAPVCH